MQLLLLLFSSFSFFDIRNCDDRGKTLFTDTQDSKQTKAIYSSLVSLTYSTTVEKHSLTSFQPKTRLFVQMPTSNSRMAPKTHHTHAIYLSNNSKTQLPTYSTPRHHPLLSSTSSIYQSSFMLVTTSNNSMWRIWCFKMYTTHILSALRCMLTLSSLCSQNKK